MTYGVELDLRLMIINHVKQAMAERGALTRSELAAFPVGDSTLRLIDQNKGIWNPSWLQATLSIVSKPNSPYSDEEVGDSLYAYAYRDGSTNGDNTKLRRACELELPIILLRWIHPGTYVPVLPVYVVRDDIANRKFILALDETLRTVGDPQHLDPIQRTYAKRLTNQRLHQPAFRGRVLLAYGRRCTICSIGHVQLLDAAHIISDTKEHGYPEVTNGLCLCKIHHAAFDADLLGISPDYQIHISKKLMQDSSEGSMLMHGLQAMDGKELSLPARRTDRPDKERLAERFAEYQSVN
ncbi:restriction endonuclease [Nocardia brasiliensis]|uniref:Restriction endonuclease n=1 Tax=Nocardia brasiliensis TaxID=37326 RepID=A0A6G9XWM9_NOCBR|nr:HNH endonuclease [Nocardia brasiliensis]QIS05325.1 restriction endonuclease [Nocardia brasiliensis]